MAARARRGARRGFYRPHGGFPAWQPSGDRQQVLDEALSWAARNDRVEAVDALVARGAALDADVYRGTALSWAAARGSTATIRRLVALGADPSRRTTFGGPGHGQATTALHLAAQNGHLDAIRALLELGADPTLEDASTAAPPPDGPSTAASTPRATCSARPADDTCLRRGRRGRVRLREPLHDLRLALDEVVVAREHQRVLGVARKRELADAAEVDRAPVAVRAHQALDVVADVALVDERGRRRARPAR